MGDTKIILPKKHLSWSQMDMWRRNPKQYASQYFENGKKLNTRYLRFGSSIAKQIEDGTYKDILPNLQVYNHVEYKIETSLEGIPLLGYIDSYDDVTNVFHEYKTGKRTPKGDPSWNAKKVQKHDQLAFYAVLLELQHGEMPWFCDLHWMETKEDQQEEDTFWRQDRPKIELTGYVATFRRNFDKREVERMKEDIIRTAHEISEAYQKFISDI